MTFLFFIVALFCAVTKNYFNIVKNKLTSILIGFLLGIIVSFIALFFTSMYYLSPYSFFPNFFHYFFNDTLFPFILCSVFVFIFIKPYDGKWNELPFFVLGFLSVYFPARALTTSSVFDWYKLFLRPIMFVWMLYGVYNVLLYITSYINNHKSGVQKLTFDMQFLIRVSCFVLFLIMPSVIDSLYVLDSNVVIIIALFVLYVGACVYSNKLT